MSGCACPSAVCCICELAITPYSRILSQSRQTDKQENKLSGKEEKKSKCQARQHKMILLRVLTCCSVSFLQMVAETAPVSGSLNVQPSSTAPAVKAALSIFHTGCDLTLRAQIMTWGSVC